MPSSLMPAPTTTRSEATAAASRMMELTTGALVSRAIRVTASLGVANHLASGTVGGRP
jgi:hypothetical protein